MTAIERQPANGEQTPGQWAVRWFAVWFVGVLVAVVPLVHCTWHVVLGNTAPVVRTRSQVAMPAIDPSRLRTGEWMAAAERSLREASPVVWWLRGSYNELRYRLGVPHHARVRFGEDEWMFLAETCREIGPARPAMSAAARAFVADVLGRIRDAGAELLVAIVPDKARVYPKRAFADGRMPPHLGRRYADLVRRFEELGVPVVDLATPLAAAAGDPAGEPLYYARDTHWRPGGALLASQAIAAAIEARFGDRLSPRVAMTLKGPSSYFAPGDLLLMSGMLGAVEPRPDGSVRPIALSLLTNRLAERRDYYGIETKRGGGARALRGEDPAAEVLLVGTSFAEEGGLAALTFALGRDVYGCIDKGAVAIAPMQRAVRELADGVARPRVVVWQIVERGFGAVEWREPKL
ncbi:MAG TPA: hypothetical protein ENI87_11025 [bacterium]|nr:hypothetical protein [bacterium]